MDIVDRFRTYIAQNKLFNRGDRVLLGVSGGRDSMLMLWLFQQTGVDILVAHCNFKLRGTESDEDEAHVRAYCQKHDIPFVISQMNTQQVAGEEKISIQMAARELRYEWFETLANEQGCSAIAIAQHKNDHIETALLNLTRGTGLAGLQGIRVKRGKLIRPLLFLGGHEVTTLVKKLNIPYRDDSSNLATKYTRNKLRLDIIPEFIQLNPNFVQTMEENIRRFQDAHQVLQQFVNQLRSDLFQPKGVDTWHIDKDRLREQDAGKLYYLFEPFKFTKAVLMDLLSSISHEPGRIFESPTHELLLDRTKVVLRRKSSSLPLIAYIHADTSEVHWQDKTITSTISEDLTLIPDRNIGKFDTEYIIFPITVRTWQNGDVFQPLGMTGRKKVSDFFIQCKINVFDKMNTPIVVNGNGDILWIAGYRMDNRYKITENTQKVLTLVCQNNAT